MESLGPPGADGSPLEGEVTLVTTPWASPQKPGRLDLLTEEREETQTRGFYGELYDAELMAVNLKIFQTTSPNTAGLCATWDIRR